MPREGPKAPSRAPPKDPQGTPWEGPEDPQGNRRTPSLEDPREGLKEPPKDPPEDPQRTIQGSPEDTPTGSSQEGPKKTPGDSKNSPERLWGPSGESSKKPGREPYNPHEGSENTSPGPFRKAQRSPLRTLRTSKTHLSTLAWRTSQGSPENTLLRTSQEGLEELPAGSQEPHQKFQRTPSVHLKDPPSENNSGCTQGHPHHTSPWPRRVI